MSFSAFLSLTTQKIEPNNRFVNITGGKCAQSSKLDSNAVKMDGFLKILIVEELVVNMIHFPYQTWLGITELD